MTRPIVLLAALSTLYAAAASAYPITDRGALTGGSSTSGLAVSDDGRYVATSQRSDGAGLAVWDRLAPEEGPLLVDVCEAVDVAFTTHATLGDAFYVACATNEVVRVDLDTSTTPPTARASEAITVGMKGEVPVALGWAAGDTVLHVVSSADSLTWLHTVDLGTDAVDGGAGVPASDTGSPVGVVVAAGLSPIVVAQSDGGLLWATRSGSTWSVQAAQSLSGTVSSISADASGVAGYFLLTQSAGEAWSIPESSPSALPSLFDDELTSPATAAFVAQSTGSPVVWIAGSNNTVDVFDIEGAYLESFDLGSAGSPVRVVPDPASTSTVWVAAGDGTVRAVTNRPWISAIAASPTSVGAGEDITLTFTVDSDSDYDLRIDSGISTTAGTSLASGTTTAAEEVSVTLNADDLTSEGDNRLVVFATSSGATGVDSVVVTLDTPPEGVLDFAVASGDGRLAVTWTSTDEEDIATYRLYVGDAAFAKDDATLPSLTLTDEDGASVDYPLQISAGDASTAQSFSVTGLTNSATYWVAIQATDTAGNEGPISDVLTASPEQTCGLAECYGDTGCSCSSSGSSPRLGLWLLLLGATIAGRRRS